VFQTFARSQQRTWGWASAQRVRASCRLLSKQLESINLAYLDNRGTTCCSSRQLGVKKLISTSDPPVQNGQQHMLCLSHHRVIMNGFHPTAGESGAVSLTLYSNAAEEEIASRSEAISDGAERVLKFSILYTHPHTHTHTHPHTHTYSPT
jgi:hypothetical protein